MPTMPTQPAFANGVVPNAAALNLLSQGVDQLAQITIGRPVRSGAAARPTLKVVRLNNLTVTTGVLTLIPWEAAEVNTDSMWASAAGDTVTIQTPGWYRIAAGVSYDPGTTGGLRIARLFVNGTADPANVTADSDTVQISGTVNSARLPVTAYEHLDAGATLHVGAYQDSGADIVLDPQSKWNTWLTARWDAPY